MNRTQMVLWGTLALQVALILLVRSPFTGASTGTAAEPLLPALDAISPGRLELDGAADESIVLERGSDGWTIRDLGGFPADGAKVDKLIEDLSGLEVRRPIVRSNRYHKAFKVADDDREARVRVWDGSGEEPDVELYVGSSPNYRTIHVRRGGSSEVYEVQGLAAYDVRPTKSSWIKKELAEVPQAQVDRLVLTNPRGRLELAKREGAWHVVAPESAAGKPVDAAKVDSLVSAVVNLRLADAVGPRDAAAQGLAQPAATVLLGWTADPAEAGGTSGEVTIEVGAAAADNASQRYVARGGSGFTGTVWESSVKQVLEDDLGALAPAAGGQG